jgi:adenosylcobinamide-phosphate synthase
MSIVTTLLALLIEATFGYPESLFRRVGHPVVWIGHLIGWCDRTLNREDWDGALRKFAGFVSLFVFVGIPTTLAVALEHALGLVPLGVLLVAVLASTLLAQRSLYQHVARVADALESGGLDAGRKAVSQIVGRDPEALDEAGVCRAAIESLAENFSDGVVAPTVWMLVGGLPGAVAYKAVNTGDSMIGHLNARHINFGYAAARLDDLVNLPASRLSALLICAAAALTGGAPSASAGWQAVRRDAPHHRSPNAGYPEAAMAGALGLSLAGPRAYGGVTVDDAFMGNGRRAAQPADIRAALRLYKVADGVLIALVAILALAFIARG